MTEDEILAQRFEASRAHLQSVAFRMLGSRGEAEDAVQDAYLRLMRGGSDIGNLEGWLTTVVARLCLDRLRARKSRPELPLGDEAEAVAAPHTAEHETQIADSIGLAMLVVLETLSPAERVAFVLHDLFALPFDEVASVLGRSPIAARQLASRGRRRIQGAPAEPEAGLARKREIVAAFLAASQGGDFAALLAILDPAIVLRADRAAIEANAARPGMPPLSPELHGRDAVAAFFRGRAKMAVPALLDGEPGLAFAFGGVARLLVEFVIEDGRIAEIAMIADPAAVAATRVAL